MEDLLELLDTYEDSYDINNEEDSMDRMAYVENLDAQIKDEERSVRTECEVNQQIMQERLEKAEKINNQDLEIQVEKNRLNSLKDRLGFAITSCAPELASGYTSKKRSLIGPARTGSVFLYETVAMLSSVKSSNNVELYRENIQMIMDYGKKPFEKQLARESHMHSSRARKPKEERASKPGFIRRRRKNGFSFEECEAATELFSQSAKLGQSKEENILLGKTNTIHGTKTETIREIQSKFVVKEATKKLRDQEAEKARKMATIKRLGLDISPSPDPRSPQLSDHEFVSTDRELRESSIFSQSDNESNTSPSSTPIVAHNSKTIHIVKACVKRTPNIDIVLHEALRNQLQSVLSIPDMKNIVGQNALNWINNREQEQNWERGCAGFIMARNAISGKCDFKGSVSGKLSNFLLVLGSYIQVCLQKFDEISAAKQRLNMNSEKIPPIDVWKEHPVLKLCVLFIKSGCDTVFVVHDIVDDKLRLAKFLNGFCNGKNRAATAEALIRHHKDFVIEDIQREEFKMLII